MTDTVQGSLAVNDEVVDAELIEDAPEPEGDDVVDAPDEEKPETDKVVEAPKSKRGKGASKEVAKVEDDGKSSDVVDAEVVENAPDEADQSAFTRSEARKLTAKLKTGLRNAAEAVMQAYDGRIWIALGYASWMEYLDSELGEYRVKLPAIERKQLVAKMTEETKMSSRAIAAALGVDQKTVVNDRKELAADAPPEMNEDGTVKVDSERGEAKVIGTDGREQKATRESKPRQVDLADRFTQHLVPADTALGELLALTTDERWEEFAGQVATRHRADLARMVRTLTEVVKALPGNGD